VVYLRADRFVPWLCRLPDNVNAPQRAALVTALQEDRSELETSGLYRTTVKGEPLSFANLNARQ
jgi:hypothetical protein